MASGNEETSFLRQKDTWILFGILIVIVVAGAAYGIHTQDERQQVPVDDGIGDGTFVLNASGVYGGDYVFENTLTITLSGGELVGYDVTKHVVPGTSEATGAEVPTASPGTSSETADGIKALNPYLEGFESDGSSLVYTDGDTETEAFVFVKGEVSLHVGADGGVYGAVIADDGASVESYVLEGWSLSVL